ncbi:MAG: exported protein of unknown function [Candidatus Thorarchaeota archaeon]|nr:MAG: exported protein of unknown function [Candidatus Thorarchaeota archaeon]
MSKIVHVLISCCIPLRIKAKDTSTINKKHNPTTHIPQALTPDVFPFGFTKESGVLWSKGGNALSESIGNVPNPE